MTDSFHGAGLALAFSREVKVQECELARNTGSGVQIAESSDIAITGCLLEGNGSAGIGQPLWMNPSKMISSTGNMQRNNVGGS